MNLHDLPEHIRENAPLEIKNAQSQLDLLAPRVAKKESNDATVAVLYMANEALVDEWCAAEMEAHGLGEVTVPGRDGE